MSSSEPQMLISSCAEAVRKLISTERYLESTISRIADGMIRIDAFTRRTDARQWVELGTDYRRVVSNSEHTAIKLAAVIKIYVSLQQDVNDEDAGDMIVELDTLKTRVAGYYFDQNSELVDLITRAERLKQQHEQAVDARRASMTRRVQDAGREVDACQTQLQELYHKHTIASQAVLQASRSSMSSYRPNLRSNSLPLPRSDEVSMRPSEENQRRKKGRSQTSLNAQTEILAHTQSSRALESQIELVRGALTDSQDRSARAQAVLHILAHADWEAIRSSMHSAIVYLRKQNKRMNALIDLRQQLLHEIGAYQVAFQGVKTYPGSARRTALRDMQERVASTAPAWKAVATLLTNEYTKGRK
ncbi:uncharacterized protein TRAVEDRAFT_66289 [Trametes versicolor FP-101664 SS1]|uniref:uncharacterized protein n=1 Tax=Trametes versicolor (strain FP-101664) TaxID=717944 RepID=UPI00046224EC|nr:uncharacterized protein TRAVEDRAFT_66289 [Trametes versicolor FP-101664 SS1]EIW54687.1 hypothetical protein TRAVEDRAFT_66289 [Trametes versicolor FP-101664 SS1]